MAKKKAKDKKLLYILHNGDQYTVIAETGKYYVCDGNTQFRKSAGRGTLVEAPAEPEETEA